MYFRKVKESKTARDLVHLLYGGATGILADTMGRMEDGKTYFIEKRLIFVPGGNSFWIKDPHWATRSYQDGFFSALTIMSLLYMGARLGYYGYKMYKYNKRK